METFGSIRIFGDDVIPTVVKFVTRNVEIADESL